MSTTTTRPHRGNHAHTPAATSLPHVALVPTPDVRRLPLNFVLSDCPPAEKLRDYAAVYRAHGATDVVRICEASFYDGRELERLAESGAVVAECGAVVAECGAAAESGTAAAAVASQETSVATAPQEAVPQVIERPQSTAPTATATTATTTSFHVHDHIKFVDGGVPDEAQVYAWLDFIEDYLQRRRRTTSAARGRELNAAMTNNATTASVAPAALPADLPSIVVHCVSGLGRAPVLIAVVMLEYCEDMEPLDAVEYVRRYRRGALNKTQLHWLEEVFDRRFRRKQWKHRQAKYKGGSGSAMRSGSGQRSASSSCPSSADDELAPRERVGSAGLKHFFGKLFRRREKNAPGNSES